MKILHLYHDLMNLYGDYANVSALCRILDQNGAEYTLEHRSLGDTLDLAQYDLLYVGSGSEEAQKLALAHLKEYKEDLAAYIESGKYAFFTGNSFEMLGKAINSFLGEYEGLGIFGFTVTEQNKVRLTADAIFETELTDSPLVGFVNKCSYITGVESPLFTVRLGLGNEKDGESEGVVRDHFYGTHLTGPVLVKNPHFLKFLAEGLVGKALSTDGFVYEKKAYDVTLKKLSQRMENS